jgi:hypothetical protein
MQRQKTPAELNHSPPVSPTEWETSANADTAARLVKRERPRQAANRMAKLEAPKRPGTAGVISAFEAYSRQELCSRTGLKLAAIRQAERNGLRAVTVGRLKFYLGCDFIEFIKAQGAKQREPRPGPEGPDVQ